MRDGRALKAGTSHYMGTNFAEAFGIQYAAESGELELCHTTSWGMSARMIGGVIMTHGDDKGLILPPLLAPYQVVIVPIGRGEQAEQVLQPARELASRLQPGRHPNARGRPAAASPWLTSSTTGRCAASRSGWNSGRRGTWPLAPALMAARLGDEKTPVSLRLGPGAAELRADGIPGPAAAAGHRVP